MRKVNIIKVFLVFILFFLSLILFVDSNTLAAFKNRTSFSFNNNNGFSKMNISINDTYISKNYQSGDYISISNLIFDKEHVRNGKLNFGSSGEFKFVINSNDTDFDVIYKIQFDDYSSNKNKKLLVDSILSTDSDFVSDGHNVYSGVLQKNSSETITISYKVNELNDLYYDTYYFDTSFLEDKEYKIEDFFEIKINFSQVK